MNEPPFKQIILLDTERAAEILNCSKRKLEFDRIKGGGIPYVKVGRSVRYKIQDIEDYIKKNTFTSTSGGKISDNQP